MNNTQTPRQIIDSLSPLARHLAYLHTILWGRHHIKKICQILDVAERKPGVFLVKRTQLAKAMQELAQAGAYAEGHGNSQFFRLKDDIRAEIYPEMLDTAGPTDVREILYEALNFKNNYYFFSSISVDEVAGLFRFLVLSDTPDEEISTYLKRANTGVSWMTIIHQTFFSPYDPKALQRVGEPWHSNILYNGVADFTRNWDSTCRPLIIDLLKQMDASPETLKTEIRLILAELMLLQGRVEGVRKALAGLDNGFADAISACLLVQEGRWSDAQKAYEAAIKRRRAETGMQKRLFPRALSRFYFLSLLAQGTPQHFELAYKFALDESGKRTPDPYTYWGAWAFVISVRLGKNTLEKNTLEKVLFNFHRSPYRYDSYDDDPWKVIMSAWAYPKLLQEYPQQKEAISSFLKPIDAFLAAGDFSWLQAQLASALSVLNGKDPIGISFLPRPGEAWRDLLAALQAIGEESSGSKAEKEGDRRIVWTISVSADGSLSEIIPMQQQRLTRSWGKIKKISLAKLQKETNLPPRDSRVANAIRPSYFRPSQFDINLPKAIEGLIGHPHVALMSDPETFIELVEGKPEIVALKKGNRFILSLNPPLRDESKLMSDYYISGSATRYREEMAALRLLTLLSETRQRWQVIRLTEAHYRVAQILKDRLEVPAEGSEAVQKTLQSLAGQFGVHSDHAQAANEVPTQSKLRAELSPTREDLILRLVAAPLGEEGPRLTPGSGRIRLMTALNGESIGTRRNLADENKYLEEILDALPFLEDPEIEGGCEWLLSDPEQALAAVETLPRLPAVAAVDWPKGKRVRVISVDLNQVKVSVKSEREWLKISGRANVDENLVLEIEALLAAGLSKSRFVPIGDGIYAALTKTLKQRLADLAALAESDKNGARLPKLAAGWLDEALNGMQSETDKAFRLSIQRLASAQAENTPLPKTLQAELRPYQEDGYRWAMRLASAGLGACLADDMGLGKTLQALAVLLQRASDGPALVLAPTSVCGNWLAEAARFAPSLNFRIYGEGDREGLLANLAAGDVIIVSYTLFMLAQDKFIPTKWQTVIADEAQAIKNASAKRSLAVFELDADFRMVLTGTPVENRLSDLWSLLRFVNPGLLGSLNRFNERFALPIEKYKSRETQHLLKRLIAPFVLRRTKAQVLEELPERTEITLAIAPDQTEAAHYEALRRNAVEVTARAMEESPLQAKFCLLAELTRLRRAACDPRLTSPQYADPGCKVEAFAELADELIAGGHKALVFSQFVDFLTLLRAPLDAKGIAYQYLDGSTPAAERTRRVAAFQAGEGDLFLISLKAGGFGLNLTAADYVVITDPWWNPAVEDQATGRAHRIGQQRPVTVYRMVTQGTLEERIVLLHHDKRALAESILSEGDASALPSTDDLIALIQGN